MKPWSAWVQPDYLCLLYSRRRMSYLVPTIQINTLDIWVSSRWRWLHVSSLWRWSLARLLSLTAVSCTWLYRYSAACSEDLQKQGRSITFCTPSLSHTHTHTHTNKKTLHYLKIISILRIFSQVLVVIHLEFIINLFVCMYEYINTHNTYKVFIYI